MTDSQRPNRATATTPRYDHDDNNNDNIWKLVIGVLLAAIVILGLLFALGIFDADVDTEGGDIDVPAVDADVDADVPDVDVDPGDVDVEVEGGDVDVEDPDAEADAEADAEDSDG